MKSVAEEKGRGREAERPREIPRSGWRDILLRVKDEQKKDNLSIVAAGVAFYAFLAIFPALAALVSIYGLFSDPGQVRNQLSNFGTILPPEAFGIIEGQLQTVAGSSQQALGAGVAIGLLLALWSSTKGMRAMITALNIAYNEREKRGFIKLNAVALLLMAGAVLFVLFSLVLVTVVPILLEFIGLGEIGKILMNVLRWPILAILVIFGLAVLYRYAPARDHPKWRWVNWGAVTATLLWLFVCGLFSLYVSNFGNYNKTYGSFGAVVILMLWFWLTAYVVLLGAEINAEMEHQTAKDSTRGEPRPMGRRGAHVADTLGEKP